MVNAGRLSGESAVAQGRADMQHAAEHWFSSDAYVTFEGQPLVFVYGPLYFRQLDHWTAIFEGMEPSPGLVSLDNYLSFGSLSNYPWPPMTLAGGVEMAPAVLDSYLERFYRNAQRRDLIVGSAFPGFKDIYAEAGVRSSYGSINPRSGDTLRHTLSTALAQNADIVQLVTWNDYGEGTTIEPTQEYGYQYLEIVQGARRELDSHFVAGADDLRLPLRLFELRRANQGNAEVNAQLDRAVEAIIAGDLAAAQAILDAQ
jgi:hypothetical protein